MSHYGTLREYRFAEEVDDIRGADLYGFNNEKLGTIEDVIFDHASGDIRYAVVDTGGWLHSRKFLVPAGRIRPYRHDENEFAVDLTKQQIEKLPPYDDKVLHSTEDWKRYEQRYQEGWHEAPVQHHHGSDRNITPPPDEMVAEDVLSQMGEDAGHLEEEADVTPQRLAGKFPKTAPGADKITMRPSGTVSRAEDAAHGSNPPGPRWEEFQEVIREYHTEIRERCPQCQPPGRKVA